VAEQQRGYLYDPIGNRTRADIAGSTTDYNTNKLNQYTAIAGIAPSYDPDGNMTASSDGMHYTYNAENRLIAAQPETPAEGDTRVENTFDYLGRRVQKIVYAYSSGAWTQQKEILFVYDGWNLVKETTIPDGGSSVDKYYVWGLDLSQSMQGAGGVGGLLAVIDGSLTYQYLYDANGNVGQLVDAADGTIAARYEYDPYGNLTDLGGAYANANAYRFSTKYYDLEVNLYYYGYRYYSPQLGRWFGRDPIGVTGGANLNSFVLNNPTNLIDNYGNTAFDLAAKLDRKQIPKVAGISAGGLGVVKIPMRVLLKFGIVAGLQAGVYFFPDSCEIAAFSIKAGIFRDKKETELYDALDWKYRNYPSTNNNRDYSALFEKPPEKPKDPNPLSDDLGVIPGGDVVDEMRKKWPELADDMIKNLPKDIIDEGGVYGGVGLSVEAARYVGGNKSREAANADSFVGIFHTVQVADPKQRGSGSVYVGSEKFTNGNWAGLTVGAYGPSAGWAYVKWDYQLLYDPIKLDEDDSILGTCLCHELIKVMP
jgi:RHS repeat-associated protein